MSNMSEIDIELQAVAERMPEAIDVFKEVLAETYNVREVINELWEFGYGADEIDLHLVMQYISRETETKLGNGVPYFLTNASTGLSL